MADGLSPALIRSLRPQGRTYEVTCGHLPGFAVRVLPSGKKVFLVRRRVDGRDRRDRLGVYTDAASLEAARRQAMALLAGDLGDADEGAPAVKVEAPTRRADPPPRKPASGRQRASATRSDEPLERPLCQISPTLRELAERFEREYVPAFLKPGSAENYRRVLHGYLLPALGDRPFDTISRRDAKALQARLSDRPALADYALSVLGSLYTRIIDDWELSDMRNPVAGIKRFGSRRVERFLSPEERRAVLAVLERGLATPRGKPGRLEPYSVWAIKLLMLTGLRCGEVLGLTWPMVDWQHASLHLPDTKTGQRSVAISHEVLVLLREIHDATHNPRRGFVVRGSRGTQLTNLDISWSRIREAAGIPDVRIHDLRHSFASDALMAGVPLAIVGEMLGHRQPSTTKRYAHLADNVVREALAHATRRIVQAAELPASPVNERVFLPLSDAEWARIAPLVDDGKPRGGRPVDMRGIVDGIRWVLARDASWKTIPSRFGAATTCWRWYQRWLKDGTWKSVAAALGTSAIPMAGS